MNAATLSQDALELHRWIHRGGEFAYLWSIGDAEDATGRTQWFRPGAPPRTVNPNTFHIYHGVHPTLTAGNQYQRAKKGERDIAAINCLYADIDDKDHGGGVGAAAAFLESRIADGLPRPTVAIGTGGGVQVYWILPEPFILVSTDDRSRADTLQKRWVAFIAGDDGAKDAARVLRTPGTLNIKEKYGQPRPVSVLYADYSTLYNLDALDAMLPPLPPSPPRTQSPRRPQTTDSAQPAEGLEITIDWLDKVSKAAAWLKRLAPYRRDEYTPWHQVGMALRELGDVGLAMWERWSQASPKYRVGKCAEKWDTFRPGDECDGITLASLNRWAEEDAPDDVPAAMPAHVQRELENHRERERVRIDILRDPHLGSREKVARLAIEPYLESQMILQREGSVRLSGKDMGRAMGVSKETGSSAIRALGEHGLLVCDPIPLTLANGLPVDQMHVSLGPAWGAPELIQPSTTKKKRGGARKGSGPKKCATCPSDTRIIQKTDVTYICEGCGEILDQEPPKYKALAPDFNFETGEDERPAEVTSAPDFNFETGEDERPAEVTSAPDFNFETGEDELLSSAAANAPGFNIESRDTTLYLGVDSDTGTHPREGAHHGRTRPPAPGGTRAVGVAPISPPGRRL